MICGGGEIQRNEYSAALYDYDATLSGMRRIVEALFHECLPQTEAPGALFGIGIGVPDAFLNRREMPRLNRHEILNRLLDDPRLRPVKRMGNVGHLFIELRGQPDAHGQGLTHICRDVSHIKLHYTTTCLL